MMVKRCPRCKGQERNEVISTESSKLALKGDMDVHNIEYSGSNRNEKLGLADLLRSIPALHPIYFIQPFFKHVAAMNTSRFRPVIFLYSAQVDINFLTFRPVE